MELSSYCMGCIARRQEEKIRDLPDEQNKSEFMKAFFRAMGNAGPDDTAPVIASVAAELAFEYLGIKEDFKEEKKSFNALMRRHEKWIQKKIEGAQDPLLEALKFARTGNYIDFGALKSVEQAQLEELLVQAESDRVDEQEYIALLNDLKMGRSLVYLTDNCGEIVMDKLFIQEIQKYYPRIQVTVIVRGKSVMNDATMEDAVEVGLTNTAKVLGNGCGAAGTPLSYISREALKEIEDADLIIAKGQGNFESLNGCGRNVYYMFLCKCPWFVKRFQMKQFEGVLVNERNLQKRA